MQRGGQVCTWHSRVAASQPQGNKLEASSHCRANPLPSLCQGSQLPQSPHAVVNSIYNFCKRGILLRLTSACAVAPYFKPGLTLRMKTSFFQQARHREERLEFYNNVLFRWTTGTCHLKLCSLRKHFPHSVSTVYVSVLNKYQVHEPRGRVTAGPCMPLNGGQMNDKGPKQSIPWSYQSFHRPIWGNSIHAGSSFTHPGVQRCLF